MSILDKLQDDHEKIKDLLSKIEEADDDDVRRDLAADLKVLLLSHSKAEEKTFYAALKETDAAEEAMEGEEEHTLIEQVMMGLSPARSPTSKRWSARLKVLRELLEHHIEEEEDEAFDAAEENFDEARLEQIGEDFEKQKKEYIAMLQHGT